MTTYEDWNGFIYDFLISLLKNYVLMLDTHILQYHAQSHAIYLIKSTIINFNFTSLAVSRSRCVTRLPRIFTFIYFYAMEPYSLEGEIVRICFACCSCDEGLKFL